MQQFPKTSAWQTISTIVIVIGSVLAGLVSNQLSTYLPSTIQTHSATWFLGTVGLILVVSIALIATDNLAPEGSLLRHNRRLLALYFVLRIIQAALVMFAGVASGPASDALSTELSGSLHAPWLRAAGPWMAILLIVLVVAFPFALELLEKRGRMIKTNRSRFLNKLFHRYESLLNDPLQRIVRAELGLAETPAALRIPQLVAGNPSDDPSQFASTWSLQRNQTMRTLFNQVGRQLLILGEPGAGKSTQLHELARQLVIDAQRDDAEPLPIILDLSTWAANRDPLETVWKAV